LPKPLMTLASLPAAFADRLTRILPADQLPGVLASFAAVKDVAFRINTLKADPDRVLTALRAAGLDPRPVNWSPLAWVLPAADKRALTETLAFYAGEIYIQNLASQLAPWVLDPQPGEMVLDLAAAPGGKTCQMAAMMANQGQISAVEPVRDRYFRLKNNLEQQGVSIARTYQKDGRAVGALVPERFDRVLLDAPCSSEARFDLNDASSMAHWSPAKVREVAHKQKRLLLSAIHALKPGGVLVYSTCSFAPEENECILHATLRSLGDAVQLEAVRLPVAHQPGLTEWDGKALNPAVAHSVRVLPDALIDGFFLARLVKRQSTR